jgi:hypothetical protein
MIERLKKTTGMLFISATLGLAGLSATAQANPHPPTPCELEAMAWCSENWSYYYPGTSYEYCSRVEAANRCEPKDEV